MPTGQGIVPPAERIHNGVKPNCALKSVGRKLSSSDQGAFQAHRLGPSANIDMGKNLLDRRTFWRQTTSRLSIFCLTQVLRPNYLIVPT